MSWRWKLGLAILFGLLAEAASLWRLGFGRGLVVGPGVFGLSWVLMLAWYFSFPARATRLVSKAWGKKDERARLRRVWHRRHTWTLAWRMPDGATASFYITNREALETSLRASVTVWERNGLVWMRLGRKRLPSRVSYAGFTARAEPKGELPVPGGVSREGPLWIDLAQVKNLLVGGAIGGGKSTILNAIIVWLAEHRPETRLMLFDLKGEDGVEFALYNVLPQLVRPVVTRLGDCQEAFEQLQGELQQRYGWLRAAGVKKLEDYNELPAGLKQARGLPVRLPRIVVAIDEFAQIWSIPRPQLAVVVELIESLTRMGRGAGIHFLIATQRPDRDTVPGQIRNNLLAVLAFYCGDEFTSGILLGQGDFRAHALDPADPGLAVWKYRSSSKLRTVLLTAEEAERRVKALTGGISVRPELPASTLEVSPEPDEEVGEELKALRALPVLKAMASSLSGWQAPLSSRVSSRW